MKTAYNIDLDVNPKERRMPSDIYALSVACFKRAELLGEKHVDMIGRVYNGFDPSCPIIKEGKFDIFYKEDSEGSLREMLDKWRLISRGFDDDSQRALELGENVFKILEKYSPFIELPWATYCDLSSIETMSIHTPAGNQGIHIHTPEDQIIQFFKPKKEDTLWDMDSLKNILLNYALSRELDNKTLPLRKKLSESWRMRYYPQAFSLYDRLVLNPASIDNIPKFVRRLV